MHYQNYYYNKNKFEIEKKTSFNLFEGKMIFSCSNDLSLGYRDKIPMIKMQNRRNTEKMARCTCMLMVRLG